MNTYHFSKTLELPLEEAIERVTVALDEEGFGILTEIDVQATIDKKLGIEMAPYRILGACNPHFAYQALQLDRHIGTMLPCSVVVQSLEGGTTEVAAIDPASAMTMVDNDALRELANEISRCLKRAIDGV